MKQKHRLSQHVKPIHYALTLQPNLDEFTFGGTEDITIQIAKPTKTINLHAAELEITNAKINIQKGKIQTGAVSYNPKEETVTFSFKQFLPRGKYVLHIAFNGILNDKIRGFYRSKYQHEGKDIHMAVTQFESTDARRAFPCFDEPAHKAVFDVTLIVPSDHQAISNTIETEVTEHTQAGYKVVKFAPTPTMSTYLLAFIIGRFEHIEAKTKDGTLVRVFVTQGKKKQAAFALGVAVKSLEFYTSFFKIPYPLPVLDMIAIPDFAAGAMENWGAVTYRETALLVDPESSSTANKQWVALVVAHELAHQWFGNLVTMEWWTHLWLNEGFAVFIEYLAINEIFPNWRIWTQFVFMDHAKALELDGLSSTHAIEVDVDHPKEINEIFDAVSYSKGASVIRMLAEYVGIKDFQKGLQLYLKTHAYSNATTADLWAALEKVSGKPIKKMMTNWTREPGYPVVNITQDQTHLHFSQARFFSSPLSQKTSNDKTLWVTPLSLISDKQKKGKQYLLSFKSLKIPKQNTSWIKINTKETGFFRSAYTPQMLHRLHTPIEQKQLSPEDRFGIVRDSFTLAEAAKSATTDALDLLNAYKREDEYIVWAEISSQLSKLSNLFVEDEFYGLFKAYSRGIFTTVGKEVGWEKKKGQSHSQALLRSVVLYALGKYGDAATIKQAQERFQKIQSGEGKLDADLRGVVYTLTAENADAKTYETFMQMYHKTPLQEEKDRILRALCSFKQKTLLIKTLEFAFSERMRVQDTFKAVSHVWGNPHGRYIAWEFVQNHWEEIAKRYGGGHIFTRFIQPAAHFVNESDARSVEAFFSNRDTAGIDRTIAQVIEQIHSNALWLKRDRKNIKTFLQKKQPPARNLPQKLLQ